MFAEEWFMTPTHYDKEGSKCVIDSDCDKAGYRKFKIINGIETKVEQRCALVEIYVATSISISEFVEPTRSLQCIDRDNCNTQRAEKGFRYLSFCDDAFGKGAKEKTERLAENIHGFFEYFNIAISEYTCIGDKNIGDACPADCEKGVCKKGKCTLL
jgi:hypothetical protein